MTKMMTMDQAFTLVDEAGEIDALIKDKTKRLKKIKEQLAQYYADTKLKTIAGTNYQVKFITQDVFDDLSPLAVYNALAKYEEQGQLFSIVKVEMKALREILPAKDIEALQGKATAEKVSLKFSKVDDDE